MRAGDLRHQLLIQRRSTAQDSSGAQVRTWVDVITVWADIQPISAVEKFYGGAQQAGVTHTILMRYHPELVDPVAVAAMRGVWEGRYFTFSAPRDEGERHRQLELNATEGLV